MEIDAVLSLLGLALRGGRLVMGEEPVEAVVQARDARLLILASDAGDTICRRCESFARVGQCLYLTLPATKAELGHALGRTSVALAALTDVGLAAAAADRLAQQDAAQYGEIAQKLHLKQQRAAERRASPRAREKSPVPKKAPPPPRKKPEHREQPPREGRETGRGRRPYGSRNTGGGQPPRKGAGSDSRFQQGKPFYGKRSSDGERSPYGPRQERGPSGAHKPYGKPASSQGHGSRDRFSNSHSPGGGRSAGRTAPYAHSRPVKKGKGSFRKREG